MADFGISTPVDARQAQLIKDCLIYLVTLCESRKKKKKMKDCALSVPVLSSLSCTCLCNHSHLLTVLKKRVFSVSIDFCAVFVSVVINNCFPLARLDCLLSFS